jgi:hypothetical protein
VDHGVGTAPRQVRRLSLSIFSRPVRLCSERGAYASVVHHNPGAGPQLLYAVWGDDIRSQKNLTKMSWAALARSSYS